MVAMTSEQWFRAADVLLLIALSALAVPVLIYGGAFAMDLIDGFKARGSTRTGVLVDAHDAAISRKQLRPRVWPRTTARPLGGSGSKQRASAGTNDPAPQPDSHDRQ